MSERIVLLIVVLVCPHLVYADDHKYDICFASGYFAGGNNYFMMQLTTQIKIDRGLVNNQVCRSAHMTAYDLSVEFSRSGKLNSEQDYKILSHGARFEKKVNKAIIKLIE